MCMALTWLMCTQPSRFPAFTGLKCNMLPFVMGDKSTLPKEYHGYWPLILACNIERSEFGKVVYLTVDESVVKEGCTQRRGGAHIEAPYEVTSNFWHQRKSPGNSTCNMLHWGAGHFVYVSHDCAALYYVAILSNFDLLT